MEASERNTIGLFLFFKTQTNVAHKRGAVVLTQHEITLQEHLTDSQGVRTTSLSPALTVRVSLGQMFNFPDS